MHAQRAIVHQTMVSVRLIFAQIDRRCCRYLRLNTALVVVAASIFVVGITLVAQDRFTVKSPNGIALAEFGVLMNHPGSATTGSDVAVGGFRRS
jgi:hypothetical protein